MATVMRFFGHEHAPRAPVKAVVTGRREAACRAHNAHQVPVWPPVVSVPAPWACADVDAFDRAHRLDQARQQCDFVVYIEVFVAVTNSRPTFGGQSSQGVHESG